MNIKEIALNIADKSGAVAYSPAPLRAVRGYSFTFEQLQNFAEALIAEIAKGNEPVAWCVGYDDPRMGRIHSNPTMYKPEAVAITKNTTSELIVCELFRAPTHRFPDRAGDC